MSDLSNIILPDLSVPKAQKVDLSAGTGSVRATRLPSFMVDEAKQIAETGQTFHVEKAFIKNALMHLSFVAGFVIPFGNLLIPYMVWKQREKRMVDELAMDALHVFNFQLSFTIYLLLLALLTSAVGIVTYPFIVSLAGISMDAQTESVRLMVPTVLLPGISIYLFYWFILSMRAVYARATGRTFIYPGEIQFLKD
ncbi:MAG: DUF4870 domain-containing protein [bacterium]